MLTETLKMTEIRLSSGRNIQVWLFTELAAEPGRSAAPSGRSLNKHSEHFAHVPPKMAAQPSSGEKHSHSKKEHDFQCGPRLEGEERILLFCSTYERNHEFEWVK